MEKYIEIWQQAHTGGTSMDSVYRSDDLVPQIAKLEKNQQRVLRYKTLGAMIGLAALLVVFMNRMEFTFFSILGIGIFAVSIVVSVLILNRLRFRITDEERSRSTLQLAAISERKILTERRIFTRYLPLFMMVALAGINLMYTDLFMGEETGTRILYHLVMSGSILLGAVVGLSVRIRRFRAQFLPLLERIRRFREESGE